MHFSQISLMLAPFLLIFGCSTCHPLYQRNEYTVFEDTEPDYELLGEMNEFTGFVHICDSITSHESLLYDRCLEIVECQLNRHRQLSNFSPRILISEKLENQKNFLQCVINHSVDWVRRYKNLEIANLLKSKRQKKKAKKMKEKKSKV